MNGFKNFRMGLIAIFLIIFSLGIALAAPPSITIDAPTGGSETGLIDLEATITDDGFITAVNFYYNNGSGDQLLGSNTSKSGDSYFFDNWDTTGVTDGNTYTIIVKATDNNSENTSETSSQFEIDNTLPVVMVTYPDGGESLSDVVTITATASDAGSGVDLVTFYNSSGGSWQTIGTDNSPPYTFSWDTTTSPNGASNLIRAEATDNVGLQSTDESNATFTITNIPNILPSVEVIWPDGGEVISNGTITIKASASDSDGTIDNVQFYYTTDNDATNTSIGSPVTSPPYEVSWDTLSATNGNNFKIVAITEDNRSGTAKDLSNNTFTIANNHPPQLSDDDADPSSGVTPVSFEFTVTYTDIDNDAPNFVRLVIDGEGTFNMTATDSNDPDAGIGYNYTKQLTTAQEYTYHFEAQDNKSLDATPTSDKKVTVNSATYETGNRIWDENGGLSTKYTWDAWSFGGFYYDLDSDEGGETLTITDIDWSLGKDDVVYTATPIPVKFERSTFGEYYVIGFMAERYFAGYKSGSIGDSGDNLLDDDKLSKVLMDDDTSQMVRAGQVLTLEEDYEFRIIELDVQGNQALVGIFKDDWKVEEDILEGGDTLVYKVDGIPIIGIHINSVFAGMESSSVRVDGIFQISDEFTSVNSGEKFGLMTIDTVSSNKIVMKNRDSISLSKHKGESFNLMGKINIEVGDSNVLRFGPVVDTSESGTYELRGTVTEEEDPEWTPLNFEGLLYDMDTGFGSESMSIERDGRSIDSGDLKYTSVPISVNFEHKADGWNSYQAIGFMGEKYFAGYTESSTFISSDRSLIGEERLGTILIDENKKYTLRLGNPLTLQEGYSLSIEDISRNGDLVMIGVYKDGDELATDILGSDETFVYDVEVGGTDIPIIVVHINSVFAGFESSSVFIDGLFQISEDFTLVENGDTYGKMEVTAVNDNKITMVNDDSFSLAKGETIDIMSDIKIKVADNSSTVRFYPFLEVIVEEPEYMELEIPESVFQNEEITMTVTSDGDEIEDATITFGDIEIGSTDSNGELTYTPIETGTITVTASKSGYESISEEIEVLHQPKALEISAPLVVDKGEEISISITSEGAKINGASVKFGSIDLGTTPSSGNITYTPEKAGTFTILVSKSGYQDASQDIDVTDPAAKLVFTNLTIEPRIVQPGQIVNITAEAANFGTIRDSDTAILKINGKTEDTRELLLDPGESVTLSFTANKTKSGTYRVELNEKTGTFKVAGEGLGSITGIVIGIIVLLAGTAIVYSIYTGTLTTEVIAAKAEAIKIQIKQLFEK